MNWKHGLLLLLITATSAIARVGETEKELAHRYGSVVSRQPARKATQGRMYTYGEHLNFRSEDWDISALMINERCEEISYSKRGEWTEQQFKHLLELNGGRSQWGEQQNRNPAIRRDWRRHDKATAQWRIHVFAVRTPVVDQTLAALEKAAKEEASKLPKF